MITMSLSVIFLILIGIGMLARKWNVVEASFASQLANLLTRILLPCMIFNSIYASEFSVSQIKKSGYLIILTIAVLLISFLVGELVYLLGKKSNSAKILRFGILFPNTAFMGYPVVETLYGAEGLFYYSILAIPVRIALFSLAKPLFVQTEKEHFSLKKQLHVLLSPPIVAVAFGLFFYLTGIRIPDVLADAVKTVGSCASTLGMFLCGLTLGEYPLKKLLKLRYFILSFFRNLLMPAIVLGFCLLIQAEPVLRQLLVIYASLAAASLTVTFAVQYTEEREIHFESAGAVLYSTLCSALTIPVWAWILAQI